MSLKAIESLLPLLLLMSSVTLAARCRRARDCNPTTITDNEICDFHKLDDDLYRGGHPTCSGLAKLQALGIRTFINLGGAEAALHRCKTRVEMAGVRFISFHISLVQIVLTGVSDKRLRKLFTLMQEAPKPIFLSCSLGRDRTGVIVALYRMKRREAAFNEAEQEAIYYGYRLRFRGLRKALERYKDPQELGLLPAPSLSAVSPASVCLPKGIRP
jgi:protein tyrosine/serine phosphatase